MIERIVRYFSTRLLDLTTDYDRLYYCLQHVCLYLRKGYWKVELLKCFVRENFDPLGVHTGDSIVIAPSQTLSDEVNSF